MTHVSWQLDAKCRLVRISHIRRWCRGGHLSRRRLRFRVELIGSLRIGWIGHGFRDLQMLGLRSAGPRQPGSISFSAHVQRSYFTARHDEDTVDLSVKGELRTGP